MEESKIIQFFEGKTILITGSTGFLAKIFMEKLLRIQPNIKKLFLLIRGNGNRSVVQRLEDEIINCDLFEVLREHYGQNFDSIVMSRLIPVSGDVSKENLGIINSDLKKEMWKELDIIVNSAATTKFDERYDVAFGINTLGAFHVQEFARKCEKLDMLLQVSTAYVHGTREGLLPEMPFHMGDTLDGSKLPYVDIKAEKKVIEERLLRFQTNKKITDPKEITRVMKDLGIERAMLHGWPNTYVFTKAMGEMLLESFKEKASVIVIRPTIITSTLKDPFPGWVEGIRTLDSIFVAYGKGKVKFFAGDPESILDMIPGDMVVNCMLATLALHSSDIQHDLFVYHIGSSRRNCLRFSELKWLMHRYLIQNPMIDNEGRPINIGQPTTLNTMSSFHNYISLRYVPLLKMLQLANIMLCNYLESSYTSASQRLKHVLRLADLYKPYLFFRGIFDDGNTEKVRMAIRGSNASMGRLNFDPTCIKWDEYFLEIHFSGVVKYALK